MEKIRNGKMKVIDPFKQEYNLVHSCGCPVETDERGQPVFHDVGYCNCLQESRKTVEYVEFRAGHSLLPQKVIRIK